MKPFSEAIETETERTRRLNDEMRACILKGGIDAYGSVVVTPDVVGQGQNFVTRAGRIVATFDAFDAKNDPYDEHDFGAFALDDQCLFFKIDYYDVNGQYHSPDKSDRSVTHRVLTIMLASNY